MKQCCMRVSALFFAAVLAVLLWPVGSNGAVSRRAAERASHYVEALSRAKASGKDIVVLQRGSDWNRLGEMLYNDVWLKDEFARRLGDGFILVAVDLPELAGGRPLRGPWRAAVDGRFGVKAEESGALRLARLSEEDALLPANEVRAVEAMEGAVFAQRADGAWLTQGGNPARETLTLSLKTIGGGQVLRLDFPTDASLPGSGPGRAKNGNFVINEVVVESGEEVVELVSAWGSASSGDHGPWHVVDGISDEKGKYWDAAGNHHKRRTLLVAMEEPVEAGAELTVRLVCGFGAHHVPGCVRGAVLGDAVLAEDIGAVSTAQWLRSKNRTFSWWDTTHCPRVALMDSEGRAVACEDKPRLGLTVASLASRVRELQAVRVKRDALWARADAAEGPKRARLLLRSLKVLGFGNWAGNGKCYKFIHDKIRAADPQDRSGAVRWLGFGRDPRDGVPWSEPSWAKVLQKKDLTDADYEAALVRIEADLTDPRNRVLDHERIGRMMIGKYGVYARWPGHQEKRFDVQRDIAAFDSETFWGIGARGELGLRHRSATPMLTYGWGARQVQAGLNRWDMTDTAYFFDHVGPYILRMTYRGGNDALRVRRVALMEGERVVSEARLDVMLGKANTPVEAALDLQEWGAERDVVLRVEVEAQEGQTDISGKFTVDPQLLPAPPIAVEGAVSDELSEKLGRGEIEGLRRQSGDVLLAAAKGDGGVKGVVESDEVRLSLAQWELIHVCGEEKLAEIAGCEGGVLFLGSFLRERDWLESFLASGKADWGQSLENLYVLWRYSLGWDGPLCRRLATALALQWGKKLPYRLVDRFGQIQEALREGLMHISFESLNVREMRLAVPTYGTARDFQFLLDDRQTRLRDYLGAHGAIRYVSHNVYGLTVQDQWNYIAPWAHVYGTGSGSRPFTAHRQVGGVCGTLSTYAPAVAQVHGIPGWAVGQPGHCAYVIRVGQEWPVGNSVTWPTNTSSPGWEGTGYPTLHGLYERVHQDHECLMTAKRLSWLAQLQFARDDTDWMGTYEQAIAAQPSNYGTWLEYVKTLEGVEDASGGRWLALARGAARDLSVAHEAGWAMVRRCLSKGLEGMTAAERVKVLLACNRELREEKWVKVVGYPYDGTLNWQADRIGDSSLAVDFFGQLLAIHHSENAGANWIFGNVLRWGQRRFAGKAATAPAYAKVMEGFFKSQGESVDEKMLAKTVATGIRKASESGDIVSYRLWIDMAAKMLGPLQPEDVHLSVAQAAGAPEYEAFAGELLSKEGMLQTSSPSGNDRPLSYTQVLSGGFGGYFEPNGKKNPWAQVQLAGEAELTGIVLVNRYECSSTHANFQWAVPLKVSVSLDAKSWEDVAVFDTAETVFRVDLASKAPKVRYVRIERPPGQDEGSTAGRFHFRNFLVYGRKLY